MKAWTRLPMIVLGLVAAAGPVDAATTASCAQLVQQINALHASAVTNAAQYWAHHVNFQGVQNGQSRLTASDASTRAQQERSAAAPLKAAMPSVLQNLKSLVQTAKSQGCLPSGQLQAIHESVFKLAKSVNFDQFTTNAPEGDSPANLPTWMPRK